jgi:Tol biopolymer transport system component
MTARRDVDRVIAIWLTEVAPEGHVDYLDETLVALDGVRQRPVWASPRRWLPMQLTLPRVVIPRAVPYLALLALLLIGVIVALAVAGGQKRLPAPFGAAANGLVAYSKGGDIYTVDPTTGVRRGIVTGATIDERPAFSLDGTRLAFLRTTGAASVVFVADADGRNQSAIPMTPLVGVSQLTWSPDGRSIAVTAGDGETGTLSIVDTFDRTIRKIDVVTDYEEVQWRPPEGRQLIVTVRVSGGLRFALVSTANDRVEVLPAPVSDVGTLFRPGGWSLDGSRFAYSTMDSQIHVLDMEGGPDVVISPSLAQDTGAYPRFSNDGRRIVFMELSTGAPSWLSVAPSDGKKPATRISDEYLDPIGTDYHWSPDDSKIALQPQNGGARVLLDPAGGPASTPSWMTETVESWQRLAP